MDESGKTQNIRSVTVQTVRDISEDKKDAVDQQFDFTLVVPRRTAVSAIWPKMSSDESGQNFSI